MTKHYRITNEVIQIAWDLYSEQNVSTTQLVDRFGFTAATFRFHFQNLPNYRTIADHKKRVRQRKFDKSLTFSAQQLNEYKAKTPDRLRYAYEVSNEEVMVMVAKFKAYTPARVISREHNVSHSFVYRSLRRLVSDELEYKRIVKAVIKLSRVPRRPALPK